MIKLTVTGQIHSISPVMDIPTKSGQTYSKREMVIDDSWNDGNGVSHPNFVMIEFIGEGMRQLDGFFPGQRVSVDAYLNGREWGGKYYHSIKGRLIRSQSTPAYQPSATPAYGQARHPSSSAYEGLPPLDVSYSAPSPANSPVGNNEDLPF